jgi:hypothetical protein
MKEGNMLADATWWEKDDDVDDDIWAQKCLYYVGIKATTTCLVSEY